MRKIQTYFLRDEEDPSRVTNKIHPKCWWVFHGYGVPTRKLDGTCCAIINGAFMKRRTVKADETAPNDFEQADLDEMTGKRFGWVPVVADDPANQYHIEAFKRLTEASTAEWPDGIYELVGPKIQGGAEALAYPQHQLVNIRDPGLELMDGDGGVPRKWDELQKWFAGQNIEGVVWHHPDGRMAKLKKKDFNLPRTPTEESREG